jgi:Protein of unknown function (DUF4058)
MAMIFPGMDPYLEASHLWAGVHTSLVVYIRDFLQPFLRPRYVAAIEERVYLTGPDRGIRPDVSIRERPRGLERGGVATLEADAAVLVEVPPEPIHEAFVTLIDLESDQRIVTVIEVLSPTNKQPGPGRTSYLSKQREVLASDVHLVEIDLLRHGSSTLAISAEEARARTSYYDYMTCVNRAQGERYRYELYPRRLQDRLPRIRIPLADEDADVVLDVQAVLAQTYEAGTYRNRLPYHQPCDPPLTADDQAWADGQIREATTIGS